MATQKTKSHTKPEIALGIATTHKAAQSRTGLSSRVIQAAKDDGCKAFSERGTIDCDMLMDFIAERPETGAIPDSASGQVIPDFHLEKALDMRASRMLKEQRFKERSKDSLNRETVKRVFLKGSNAWKKKLYTLQTALVAEASMKLSLSLEQNSKLAQITQTHVANVLSEMNKGDWKTIGIE